LLLLGQDAAGRRMTALQPARSIHDFTSSRWFDGFLATSHNMNSLKTKDAQDLGSPVSSLQGAASG
jgi:hypothetical protein